MTVTSVGNVLSARNVVKIFAREDGTPTLALADVSLEVSMGEVLVLVGASGCGKTTFLRLFAGLELPTAGEVQRFGRTVTGPAAEAALVFQSSVLLPWRTIRENVMLPAEIQRRKGSEWRDRATELLEMTGLAAFADAYPRELSGGMRQRASICRALLLDPPILFMDEPFGALDAITRATLNRELYATWRHTGKTIVFVTHDITEAVRLGSRVVVMTPRPGRIAHINEIVIDAESYDERIESQQYVDLLRELEHQVHVITSTTERDDGSPAAADADLVR